MNTLPEELYPYIFSISQRRSINKKSRGKSYEEYVLAVLRKDFSSLGHSTMIFRHEEVPFYHLRKFDYRNPGDTWDETVCAIGIVESLDMIKIIVDGVIITSNTIPIRMALKEIDELLCSDYESEYDKKACLHIDEVYRSCEIGYLWFIRFYLFDQRFKALREESPGFFVVVKSFMTIMIKNFLANDKIPNIIKYRWFDINLLTLTEDFDKPKALTRKLIVRSNQLYYGILQDITDSIIELVSKRIDVEVEKA